MGGVEHNQMGHEDSQEIMFTSVIVVHDYSCNLQISDILYLKFYFLKHAPRKSQLRVNSTLILLFFQIRFIFNNNL